MPRYKSADRDEALGETRRLLLDAAVEEFAREGYAGAKIDRISRSAGFAKGTIYNHFESKRALMLALIDELAQVHLDFVAERVRQESDADCRLERFFEAGFAFVSTHLAQSWILVNNIYGPDAEFKERMYRAYQPMFELVNKDIVALGISQGIFRQVDPQATAALLMTLYLGTGSQVDDKGSQWLPPLHVAGFALNGLRRESIAPTGGSR